MSESKLFFAYTYLEVDFYEQYKIMDMGHLLLPRYGRIFFGL